MKWIWQLPNWPQFTFDPAGFTQYEREFHRNAGVIIGSLAAVSADESNELRVSLLSSEAMDTSKIEGEILDRDSVQSSIRKQLGLQTDGRRAGPKEIGVAQMMVNLVRNYQQSLVKEQLFAWHQMIMNGRIGPEIIEGYRTYADPMQIVSGRLDQPKVYYEAPPSDRVTEEMNQYIAWFKRALDEQMPTVVHAGIAHLYFELIHLKMATGALGVLLPKKYWLSGLGNR